MDPEIAFGIVLRRLRSDKDISQEDLAFRSNLDRTYISMIERGKRNPTINTLFSISKALGINPANFIALVEQEITSN